MILTFQFKSHLILTPHFHKTLQNLPINTHFLPHFPKKETRAAAQHFFSPFFFRSSPLLSSSPSLSVHKEEKTSSSLSFTLPLSTAIASLALSLRLPPPSPSPHIKPDNSLRLPPSYRSGHRRPLPLSHIKSNKTPFATLSSPQPPPALPHSLALPISPSKQSTPSPFPFPTNSHRLPFPSRPNNSRNRPSLSPFFSGQPLPLPLSSPSVTLSPSSSLTQLHLPSLPHLKTQVGSSANRRRPLPFSHRKPSNSGNRHPLSLTENHPCHRLLLPLFHKQPPSFRLSQKHPSASLPLFFSQSAPSSPFLLSPRLALTAASLFHSPT